MVEAPKPIVETNESEFDTIRARSYVVVLDLQMFLFDYFSILPYTYNYKPPANVGEVIKEVLEATNVNLAEDGKFKNLKDKSKACCLFELPDLIEDGHCRFSSRLVNIFGTTF